MICCGERSFGVKVFWRASLTGDEKSARRRSANLKIPMAVVRSASSA